MMFHPFMRKTTLLTFALLIAFPTLGRATQPADTSKVIDQIFASWTASEPGGTVLVARGTKIIYHKAYGLAELEHAQTNRLRSVYESGSISKQFTAAAILMLAKQGKVSLDADVRTYVPELPVYDTPITIRHLFYHTSGLKDWGVIAGVAGWPRTTRAYTQALAMDILLRQQSTNFPVGTAYNYSNSNYTLLTEIVQRVSGQTLAAFTEAHFFKPLGMQKTRWRDDFRAIVPLRSVAYMWTPQGYKQQMPFEDVHGHGGLLTTTEDLLTWNQQLTTDTLFGPELTAERLRMGTLTDGKPVYYAAGLSLGRVHGYAEISHSGATAAYRSWLAYYPDQRLTVIILSNNGRFNPLPVGRSVAEVYLKATPSTSETASTPSVEPPAKAPEPYALTLEQAHTLVGSYHSHEADATFHIYLNEQQQVWVYRKAGDHFELKPIASDRFATDYDMTIQFTRDKQGQIKGFLLSTPRAEQLPFVREE
jgi:CubicO group peptidase (beta-lactamase class C family)